MSARGQKRTPFTASLYVRFTPESGHSGYRTACPLSAKSRHWPKQHPLEVGKQGSLADIRECIRDVRFTSEGGQSHSDNGSFAAVCFPQGVGPKA